MQLSDPKDCSYGLVQGARRQPDYKQKHQSWQPVLLDGAPSALTRMFRRLPDAVPEFRDAQLSITIAFFDVRISKLAASPASAGAASILST